jgi:catechol 2,3-dioxygenase-like lactoylglutathione lyase family enzyme
MDDAPSTHPVFGRLHHVGLVVSDIERAIAHFEALGFGPFRINDDIKVLAIDFVGELQGRPAEWQTKVSNGLFGDVEFELLEPSRGDQALRESLDAEGEGLHHLGFMTTDVGFENTKLRAIIAEQTARGATVWTSSFRDDAPSFCYFAPSAVGRLAIEVRTPGEG